MVLEIPAAVPELDRDGVMLHASLHLLDANALGGNVGRVGVRLGEELAQGGLPAPFGTKHAKLDRAPRAGGVEDAVAVAHAARCAPRFELHRR